MANAMIEYLRRARMRDCLHRSVRDRESSVCTHKDLYSGRFVAAWHNTCTCVATAIYCQSKPRLEIYFGLKPLPTLKPRAADRSGILLVLPRAHDGHRLARAPHAFAVHLACFACCLQWEVGSWLVIINSSKVSSHRPHRPITCISLGDRCACASSVSERPTHPSNCSAA